jgi:hypothetical protein
LELASLDWGRRRVVRINRCIIRRRILKVLLRRWILHKIDK